MISIDTRWCGGSINSKFAKKVFIITSVDQYSDWACSYCGCPLSWPGDALMKAVLRAKTGILTSDDLEYGTSNFSGVVMA